MSLFSASPILLLVIPGTRHFARLTSHIPTRSVSCFADSTVDREFADLLKDTDKLDAFRNTLGAERGRSSAWKTNSTAFGKVWK